MILKNSYNMKPPESARILKSNSLGIGLVGFWVMNEGGGDEIFDANCGLNPGTFNGTPAWTVGDKGAAIDFGSGDYITIANEGNFDFERTDPFSLYLRYRADGNSSGAVLSKSINDRGYILWSAAGVSNPMIQAELSSAPGNIILVQSPELTSGVWYDVLFTYDGTSTANGTKIYIDGRDVTSIVINNLTATMLNNVNFQVSAINGATLPHDGQISSVAVWNRELVASEAIRLSTKPFCLFDRPARPLYHVAAAPPPAIQSFMDLSTMYWTVKKASGLYTRM